MAEKKTSLQQLSDLVEWFLEDRQVELKFVPNEKRQGRAAPEFNFEYWMDGRRITERTLCLLILSELARRNYPYVINRILAALAEHSWRYYVANHEYPEWLAEDATPKLKRPPGRPRKRAPKIKVEKINIEPLQEPLPL